MIGMGHLNVEATVLIASFAESRICVPPALVFLFGCAGTAPRENA